MRLARSGTGLALPWWRMQSVTSAPPTRTISEPVSLPAVRIAGPIAGTRRSGTLRDGWWFAIVFLVALAIFCATDSGRIVFDTKLGVDIDPAEFLTRLWSLWNPLEWFGSLQDQYIGYALPMAPFFLVAHILHIPIWLTERLWPALLLAVGFTGLVKLARALDIGSESSRILAGAVFALWPTFTILFGSTSAAALPGLMVPWAILPLVSAIRGRSATGRAAARSGVAIALMGGVNAVCTLAVLVLPALYILTHTRARQRVVLGVQWAVAAVAATAWWVVPLLLQGKYSFNFLPYIEQSQTTMSTMSAAAVLRGTGTWTAYFNFSGISWLAAGWSMVTAPAAILASTVAAATGLAGLARRDMPERRWLTWCAGLVVVVALAGYFGPLGDPWHASVDAIFNASLAPFRSLYKLEPVLAVVIALGCAHAMDRIWRLRLPIGRIRLVASVATAPVVALTLAGLAWPQLTGQALQAGSFQSIPRYWYQTAAYLAANSPRETALVVPANPHAQFTWGDTIDNPLEPLATSPWVERGLVPYGGAGSQVLLETAEQAVESGQQVPGLAGYLARAGVRYVVVRNDTSAIAGGYTPPQVANETMAQSGFHRVAAFGPQIPAGAGYPNVSGQVPGFAPSYPAVEIFEANHGSLRPDSPVSVLPVSQTVLVNGGTDTFLQLAAQHVLGDWPAVIAGQRLPAAPANWVVTDGQRRTDNEFGSTLNYQSYTYTATQANPVSDPLGGAGQPPRQLLPVAAAGHQTVAVLAGAAGVNASSAGTWLSEAPQDSPVNAFDGNQATAWVEGSSFSPDGQWLQVNFDHRIDLPASVGIKLLYYGFNQPVANELRVTTAAGSAITDVDGTGNTQPLRVPPGPSGWLRITILGASNADPGGLGVGITEVNIPGVRVTTYLQPAEDVAAGQQAPAVTFSFAQEVASPVRQDSAISVLAGQQLDRTFVTTATTTMNARLTAVPTAGTALTALISRLTPVGKSEFQVAASSSWDLLPQFGPVNLYKPGAHPPWISNAGDPNPQLVFRWHGRRTIKWLILRPATGVAAFPSGVLVGGHGRYRLASVGIAGVVRVSPPIRTSKLYLSFPAVSEHATGNTAAGQPPLLPVGLAGVKIPALTGLHAALPVPTEPFRLACGQGPALTVDGHRYKTSVSGTVGDLMRQAQVQLRLCTPAGALTLGAGRHVLSAASSAAFTVSDVSLSNQAATATPSPATQSPAAARSLQVLSWGSDNRTLQIGPGAAAYVEVHEDADAGWAATLNGRALQPATLDGWQQAFVVPAGQGGTIQLRFRPATVYHAGLAISALLLLILLCLAIGTDWIGRLRRRIPALNPARRSRRGPGQFSLEPPSRPLLIFRAASPIAAVAEPVALSPDHGGVGPASENGSGQSGQSATAREMHGGPAGPSGRQISWRWLARTALLLLPLTLVIVVAGGPIAIAVPVLAVLSRWRPRWLPGVAAAAMLVVGLLIVTSWNPTGLGTGPFSAAAQVLALLALTATVLPVLPARPAPPAPATEPGDAASQVGRTEPTVLTET